MKMTIPTAAVVMWMASTLTAGELVRNGGMEETDADGKSPKEWTSVWKKEGNPSVSRDTTVFKSGTASLCLDCGDAGDSPSALVNGSVSGLLQATSGKLLKVSGSIMVKGDTIKSCQVALHAFSAKWKQPAWASAYFTSNPVETWTDFSKELTIPEGATSIRLTIVFTGKGKVWVDNLSVMEPDAANGDATATADANSSTTPAAVSQVEVIHPERKNPPWIVLKFDDVYQNKGDVLGQWKNLAHFLESHHIKGGFGVICETLQNATPEYTKWIKERNKAGLIEFWFHGWDHGCHEVGGTKFNEFSKRSYVEQKERFDKSQGLAQEKLGFAFRTFGPPGGAGNASFDAETVKVMQDDPNMKAWLYPQPIDEQGRTLEAAGKVMILDRVWAVNLEGRVGVPDFGKFVTGYVDNSDRQYFVLQGHPGCWDQNRFGEFVKIIDYLEAEKAVFMTPSECAAALLKAKGK